MTDLLCATLARRGTVAADTLLDCLALAVALDARPPDCITLTQLRFAWRCSNFDVIKRMDTLRFEQLVDTTYHSGRNAYWEVHRVGPE